MLSHLKNNEGKIRISIVWMTIVAFVFVVIFFYGLIKMTDGMPGLTTFKDFIQEIWNWISSPFRKTI